VGKIGGFPSRVLRVIGRRGAFLAFLAILDILIGYSLFTAVPAHPVDLVLPLRTWAYIWVGAGAFIATGILTRWDRVQYTAAAGIKAAWGLLYMNMWFHAVPRAWVSVVIWLSFAAIIALIAGWPEFPPELPPPPHKDNLPGGKS
jgi:predicted membrane metal-binding protein